MRRFSLRHSYLALVAVMACVASPGTARAQGGGATPGAPAPSAQPAQPLPTAPPAAETPAPNTPAANAPAAAPAPNQAAAPVEGPPAETAAQAAAEEAEEAAQKAVWAERDQLINESNTITGGAGLLKTQHAQSGAPGQFRVSFVGEGFSAGFLCTDKFPCPNNKGPGLLKGDTMNHIGGTLSVGASLFNIGAGIFEAYLSTGAYANSDTSNSPPLLQVVGDTNIGIKYGAPVGNVVHLGLFTELWLISGTGAVGLDGSGTSAKFGGLGTLDFRGLESHTPVRFSLNAVYSVDNTGDVVATTEQQRGQIFGLPAGQSVTRIERFGLGVNRIDHFDLLAGIEFFAAEERVRPFIEGKILIPNNRQGYACRTINPSQDNCMANSGVIPSTLTIGSRFLPWKRGFSLLAAVDIGLTGTNDFVEELSPVPPWVIYIGGGWAIDTWERPPVIKTKLVEKVVEKTTPKGHVIGFVHEKDKNTPIIGAIVAYHDQALSPLSTGPDGKFADEVPPGQYTYDIKADGYKPASCDANVPKEGGDISLDCALEPLPRVGSVSGHVRDAETSQPLGGIPIVLTDSQKKELRLTTDGSGGFKFENVAPGAAELSIVADAYLVLVVPTEVKARQDTSVDIMLRPKPKQANVTVTPTEITIKQQIQFALDSAVILPESFGLLTEIADTFIRHPEIRRVEVQGHTDNSGTPDHNKILSDQRAEAVRAWLVQHGVQGDRLVARGYGQDKPVVPNITPQMRARNRRVQFIILEKQGSPALPGIPPAAPGERPKTPLPGF
jgi:outer membrane protein OmpA-like peptidoglycan-associated protein